MRRDASLKFDKECVRKCCLSMKIDKCDDHLIDEYLSRGASQDGMLMGWPKFSKDAGFHNSWPACNRCSLGASCFLLLVIGIFVCMSACVFVCPFPLTRGSNLQEGKESL